MNGSNSAKPLISVVMAAFNAGPYLKENIQSILNQTYSDFEFIIIDDASTDNSAEIIWSFKDPRLIYIKNEVNLGQTASLNKGIRMAKGKYIARLDADDIAYPERLKMQADFLNQHPQVGVVGSWSIDMDETGKLLKPFKVPTDLLKIKCFIAASGDLSYWCISHPTVMIRKSVLEDVGLFNEIEGKGSGYPQDYELWERIARKYDFAVLGKVLLKYRILKNSDSRFYFDKYRNHRWEITQRRIRYYLPHLNQEDFNILLYVLEYRPQELPVKVQKVLKLFEDYMKVYLRNEKMFKEAKPVIDLMKLYYLPQLFLTNPSESVGEIFKIVLSHPAYLFDVKFYRKAIKTYFQKTMSEEQFKELCKKTL